MKVALWPEFSGTDDGDGGVRRVVEAQLKAMPRLRVEFTNDVGDADLIACHITAPDQYLRKFPDKPLVAHCHGLYWSEYEWENWAYRANEDVLKLVMAADVVTAPAEWVSVVLRRHTCRDVRTVPHGI